MRNKGFTLIELLIVIGITMLIIALLTLGYRHLNRTIGERDTQVDLQACASILQSYLGLTSVGFKDINNQVTLPYIEDSTGNYVYKDIPGQRAYVDAPVGDASQPGIYSAVAIINTQKIIQQLMQRPEAKTLIQNFPTQRSASGNNLPILLDSWKQPIIFVPAGGLNKVTLTHGSSTGSYCIVAVDGSPFWASAGQNGDFSLGDDNLYSKPVRFIPAH